MGDRKIRKKDCVRLSNKIIQRCQLAVPAVENIGDIGSDLFVALLQVLCGQLPPGVILTASSEADEVQTVQAIINHLALDLINVDLSHISGEAVIGGNARAIYNLLEIFCGLHKYLSSTDIDKWNLEESLTETEEELSSTSSSSDPGTKDDAADQDGEKEATADSTANSPGSGTPAKQPSRSGSATDPVVSSGAVAGRRDSPSGSPPRSASRSGSAGLPPVGSRGSRGSLALAGVRSGDASTPTLESSASATGSSGLTASVTTSSSGSTNTAGTGIKTDTSGVSFPESEFSLSVQLPMSPPTSHPALSPTASRPAVDHTAGTPDESAPAADATPEADADSEVAGEPTPGGQEARLDEVAPEQETTTTDSAALDTSGTSSPGTEEGGEKDEDEEDEDEDEDEDEGEEEQERRPIKPFVPRHFQFAQDSEETTEDAGSADETDPGEGDISRQLSDEMRQMRTSSGTEKTTTESPPATADEPFIPKTTARSSGSDNGTRTPTPPATEPTEPTEPAEPAGGEEAARHRRKSRPGRSAPCTPAARAAAAGRLRRRCRISEVSSVSDPGVGRRPPGRRLLTRNIETIAEIHESGGESAIAQTTRVRRGDKLKREVISREVRRKVHSAPQPGRAYYSRQSSRRSACSDGVMQWLESQADETHLKVEGEETDVFEFLRREFPYVHVSEETKRKLLAEYRQQMKYIMSLTEPTETRTFTLRRQDVLRRQSLLTDIMRQQKAHDRRFRRICDQKRAEIQHRNGPRDNKISCLRAQRYVDSFKQQFQSRMALNKSREELLMKAVFEEMLEIQRRRLRTVRSNEKQAIKEFYGENGYTADLNRMHQFYEANFRDLSQLLSRERADLKISEHEQQRLADRIRREFRHYMESDVQSLNDKIVNSWQPQYRELDADRIRSDLYQANWRFCVT